MEEKGCEDGCLRYSPAPTFIGGSGKRADPSTGNHRPPPPIQEDWAPALMLYHTMRLRYLPCSMHEAYVAKDKGVVGIVNWKFLPRALKSFTGHYQGGPITIGFTRCAEKSETDPRSRLTKKQRRPQEANLFSSSACALIRPYPDDARQRVRGRPRGFCR